VKRRGGVFSEEVVLGARREREGRRKARVEAWET
jgi:hypothetical protein